MWGPAGDRGSLEWWPGEDVVDVVSIAIYGLPDKNLSDPRVQEPFERILKRKLWRLRFVDKPVLVAEFGVLGPEPYQREWLLNAAMALEERPIVIGASYFNREDVEGAWGDIPPPQWSIDAATFRKFVSELDR